jgi:hypothetical protein
MQTHRLIRSSTRLGMAMFSVLALMLAVTAGGAMAASPDNDNFADAQQLNGFNGTADLGASTVGATLESGEPTVAGATTGATTWFRYTPIKSGTARVSACGSFTSGAALGVYTGSSLGSLTPIASGTNNCANSGGPTTGNFGVTAGATYWIQSGTPTGGSGSLYVDFSTGAAPANDNLANASTLSDLPVTVDASNFLATAQPAEPFHAGSSAINTVWFKYTPPVDGTYAFDTCSSPPYEEQDSVVSIYTSASATPAIGDLVDNNLYNDDSCDETPNGTLSRWVGSLDALTTVWIQVGNYGTEHGVHLTLRAHRIGVPENLGTTPYVFGPAKPGINVSAGEGDWEGADSFEYQWMRCDADGADCADIDAQTGDHYLVTSDDLGHKLRVLITATNSSGSVSVLSSPTRVVEDVPANDDVANAIDLGNLAHVERVDDDYFASYEGDDEPFIGDNYRPSSVWYTWTAPADGTYQVSTCGGSKDWGTGPYVDAFTSSADPGGPTTVTEIASNVNECDGNYRSGHEADFSATAGMKYWIGVGSNGGSDTDFRLTIDPTAAPVFTTAPSISGTMAVGELLTGDAGDTSPAAAFYLGWYVCDRNHENCIDMHHSGFDFVVTDQALLGSVEFRVEANNLTDTTSASGFIDGPPPTEGGSGSTPPPPVASKPIDPLKLITPKSLGTIKAGKKGVLTFKTFKLTCGASASGACTGTVKLTTKIKKRNVTLGSAKLKLSPGDSSAVKLKLSKAGLKTLKKAKKLKATLKVSAAAPGFSGQSTTTKLTLKP